MMGVPTGTRIWLAAGFTDLRKYAPRSDMHSGRGRSRVPVEGNGISAVHNAPCALQASTSPKACRAPGSVRV
jgi:hypothetical protein